MIGQVFSFYLAQNYRREIEHARLAKRVTPDELRELYPAYPKSGLVTLAALRPLFGRPPLDELARLLPPFSAQANASNNWVVDGAHSQTGAPILENDPHLTYTTPGIWYLAQIETKTLSLTGGFLPGVPFMVVGHNNRSGWGMTETGGDVEDLFVEKLDPQNPDDYLTPQGPQPFRTLHETIHVKGGADVPIDIRLTRHGPVISDVSTGGESMLSSISTGVKSITPPGDVLALQATFLEPGDKTPQALWEMDQAQSWEAFRKALRDYGAPQMNIVYADAGGTIAFMAPGRIPIRKTGDGWLPAPGWTGEYDWKGLIPFDALPRGVNPPSGRFISANNKIVPDGYPNFITRDWARPYRADRIAERLDQKPVQSLDSTSAIAADTVSLMARQLLPLMLQTKPADAASAKAEAILEGWDGDMRRNSPAPVILVAWMREFERELFERPLGDAFTDIGSCVRSSSKRSSHGIRNGAAGRPANQGIAADVLSHSLQAAVAGLANAYGGGSDRWLSGGDPGSWRWGRIHPASFDNIALRHVPLIGWLFNQSIPAPGGNFTVNAGDMDISDGRPYRDVTGPGLRMILDFSDLSKSRFLMAPGVSEDPFSPHYGDLLRGWRDFRWIVPDRAKPVATLTLKPPRSNQNSSPTAAASKPRATGLWP